MPKLTDEERATYEWQMWERDFGEKGQEALKGATALVSRLGGLGGPLAQQLAAAGFGKVILAHGGNVKHSDLNRQVLMTYDWLGKPRVESAARRLRELNPRLEVEPVPSNINEDNAAELVAKADIVFDCAPLFAERFLMNRECVRQRKPLIDCAMFSMEGQVTVVVPGRTACLACLYPEDPPEWKREFPVFGAVSALAACVGVMEAIKLLSGIGASLEGKLLYYDLRHMTFRTLPIARRPDCPVCGDVA
ncbi:HesA/MoeB/ThiF family protein [bacterium]|nr:HesA/MoeB/ThiF family protein [bacterium]